MEHDESQPEPPVALPIEMGEEAGASADALTDIDLYCLECGYNLRGLSGDPRRCPECGHLNPLGDISLPAEQITRQLRRMESAPTYCVGILLAVLFVLFVTGLGIFVGEVDIEDISCFAIPALLGAIPVWLTNAYRFREYCQGKPGWFDLLMKYQLLGLIACFGVILPFAVLTTGVLSDLDDTSEAFKIAGTVMTMTMPVAAIVLGGRWVYRHTRSAMETMQREVAVSMARERLRQELQRKPRAGEFGPFSRVRR